QVSEGLVPRAFVVSAGKARRAAAAAQAWLQHHSAPDSDFRDNRRHDFAGHVAAGNVRHRDLDVLEPAPRPQIEMIEGAGAHPHQNFAGLEWRLRNVLEAEDISTAVLVESDSLHLDLRSTISDLRSMKIVNRQTSIGNLRCRSLSKCVGRKDDGFAQIEEREIAA